MPFSPPPLNAVNFTATGQAYTRPPISAANFVLGGVINVQGAGAITVDFLPAGQGEFVNVAVDGDGQAAVEFIAAGVGAVGVGGAAGFAAAFAAAGVGAHGESGAGAAAVGFAPAGGGLVERYEVRGEVRIQGGLFNRLVRVYRRDTGELAGEQNTTAGVFRIPCGFVPREHYLLPIDAGNDAEDWTPPCANRVVSVLAQDAA